LTFLIDVDGVIADYTGKFSWAVSIVTGRDIDVKSQQTDWDLEKSPLFTPEEGRAASEMMAKSGVAETLVPLPGAVAGVGAIAEHAKVLFLTSHYRYSKTWVHDRDEWLKEHFGTQLGKQVIHTHHKYAVLGDVFVDDKVSHLEMWHDNMSQARRLHLPVCWSQPYNKDCTKFLRVGIWEPLITIAWGGTLENVSFRI
jgi:5'(3')-deoxyribonucleotidase